MVRNPASEIVGLAWEGVELLPQDQDGHVGIQRHRLPWEPAEHSEIHCVLSELEKADGSYAYVMHLVPRSWPGAPLPEHLLVLLAFQHFPRCPDIPDGCLFRVLSATTMPEHRDEARREAEGMAGRILGAMPLLLSVEHHWAELCRQVGLPSLGTLRPHN